ncbi:MAG TPA: nucleotidyltransferase family protein [Methylomirabilota bacterium]
MVHDPAALAAETRLLLACARLELTPADARGLEALLASSLRWDVILEEARRHGLVPLLHRHRERLPLPPAVRASLERLFERNTRRALVLAAELVALLAALRGAGIEPMPYKGPALAVALYGNPTLRQFQDLDVIVTPAEVAGAARVLRDLGYRPERTLSPMVEAAMLASGTARTFVRGECIVELHWAVLPPAFGVAVNLAAIRARQGHVMLGGARVPVPSPEDLLRLLVLHGGKHVWERIAWLADIADLLRWYPDLDHAALAETARRTGAGPFLTVALALAHRLLDAPLPPALAAASAVPRVERLVHALCARRLAPEAAPRTLAESVRFHLRSLERWPDRLRYASRLALTPTDGDVAATGRLARFRWAPRAVRPLRLARKYGARAVREAARSHF